MKIDIGDALMVLANTNMRPFTKEDYYAFAGVESKLPLIGEAVVGGEECVVIVDGDKLSFVGSDVEEITFVLTDPHAISHAIS